MKVTKYNHKASEDMDDPPEGSYDCYYISLAVSLSYLLT